MSLTQTFKYFHFFMFGILLKYYWAKCEKIMGSKYFSTILFFIAILSSMDCLKFHILPLQIEHFEKLCATYSVTIMVIMFFRYYATHFSKMKLIGRFFQYVGKNTLDIYLIHFVFLPTLPCVGLFISNGHHNFIVEVTTSVTISILVIAYSVIASKCLRLFPLVEKYILGRKKTNLY